MCKTTNNKKLLFHHRVTNYNVLLECKQKIIGVQAIEIA